MFVKASLCDMQFDENKTIGVKTYDKVPTDD
jgi:hypothetical protein